MGAHAIAWDATEGEEAGRILHDKERARAGDITDRVRAPLPPLTAPEQTINDHRDTGIHVDTSGIACLEVCEGVAMALELLVRSDSELWDEQTRPPFNPHTVATFSEHHPLGPWRFVDIEHKDDERYLAAPARPAMLSADQRRSAGYDHTTHIHASDHGGLGTSPTSRSTSSPTSSSSSPSSPSGSAHRPGEKCP